MRRELVRALGEWVHACEEVRENNGRLLANARAQHNAKALAVKRRNRRREKEEEAAWEEHRYRVLEHNADVERMMEAYNISREERERLVRAHALLVEWLEREKGRRVGKGEAGWAQGQPYPRWRVPKECLEALWGIANSEPEERDETARLEDREAAWVAEIEKVLHPRPPDDEEGEEGGGKVVRNAGGRQQQQPAPEPTVMVPIDSSLAPLDPALVHPVPGGVSSSALHGGSGGAPRPDGYDGGNDQPLMASYTVPGTQTTRSLAATRPANLHAISAEEYREEWDGRNWDREMTARGLPKGFKSYKNV